MKRNSKGYLIGALVLGLLGAGAALAGERLATVVFIDDVLKFASGSLGAAHNSVDRVQYIGCSVAVMVHCAVRNRAGLARVCISSDAGMMANVRGINGGTMLSFTWNTRGECTSVTINNTSIAPPKVLP